MAIFRRYNNKKVLSNMRKSNLVSMLYNYSSVSLTLGNSKLECLSLTKNFHARLIFASAFTPLHEYVASHAQRSYIKLQKCVWDEHSSLFNHAVSGDERKIHNFETNYNKNIFPSLLTPQYGQNSSLV